MSVTAAGADVAPVGSALRSTAVAVYEAAADASVLGGNLSFYCTCLSRLTGDFYPAAARAGAAAARAGELAGARLLYYAMFARAPLEVACALRALPAGSARDPNVAFALRAAGLAARGQYQPLARLYGAAGRRQRTVMLPALRALRAGWVRTLARAYLSLEEGVAAEWLGMDDAAPGDVRRLVVEVLPSLKDVNEGASETLQFRATRR